jgi:hypothetical protein
MKPTESSADYALQQYEALRQEATESAQFGRRGHGLSLFLARGMTIWLAALTALTHKSSAPAQTALSQVGPVLHPSVRSDMTLVLAGMVLACSQEGR